MAGKAAVLMHNLRGSASERDARQHESLEHEAPRKQGPRYAFRALAEIIAHLRSGKNRVLLLDLDGTLVGLRRRPQDVRVPERARRILKRLAELPHMTVAILSGRNARDLQKLIDLKTLHYLGLHGGEADKTSTPISSEARRALRRAKRSARLELAEFSGVDVEDKGHGFTVHYRGADPAAVRGANRALLAILAPLRHALYLLNGKKVWEVLPHQIPGKGRAIRRLMADSPQAALAYIGDDEPDEPAFAALEGHVTIHVGKNENTHARFYLRNPSDVLRFLSMLETELR
jgi:trehalose-phosphatase